MPSKTAQIESYAKGNRSLLQTLEGNLINPNNKWQPKDHSTKFMRHLRNYSTGDLALSQPNQSLSKSIPRGLRKLEIYKNN